MAEAGEVVRVEVKHWRNSRLMKLAAGLTLYGVADFAASFIPNLTAAFPGLATPGGRWTSILHAVLGLAVAYLRTRTTAPLAGTPAAAEAKEL
jgi:hypothetical protein